MFVIIGVAALAGFGLAFSDYFKKKDQILGGFDYRAWAKTFERTEINQVEGHLGSYDDYEILHELNITGKIVEVATTNRPVEPPKPKVGPQDLILLFTQFHPESLQSSYAYLQEPGDQVENEEAPGDLYQEGDTVILRKKQNMKLDVVAIRQQEIDIQIKNNPESKFTLRTQEFEVDPTIIGDVATNADGAAIPVKLAPRETRQVGFNQWEIGTEDLDAMEKLSEEEILSQVQVRKARDAAGEVEGLMISRISEDSVFARQGLRKDDIVTNVNGFAVRDRKELLDWFRGQKSLTTVEVEVKRRGGLRTIKYAVPARR